MRWNYSVFWRASGLLCGLWITSLDGAAYVSDSGTTEFGGVVYSWDATIWGTMDGSMMHANATINVSASPPESHSGTINFQVRYETSLNVAVTGPGGTSGSGTLDWNVGSPVPDPLVFKIVRNSTVIKTINVSLSEFPGEPPGPVEYEIEIWLPKNIGPWDIQYSFWQLTGPDDVPPTWEYVGEFTAEAGWEGGFFLLDGLPMDGPVKAIYEILGMDTEGNAWVYTGQMEHIATGEAMPSTPVHETGGSGGTGTVTRPGSGNNMVESVNPEDNLVWTNPETATGLSESTYRQGVQAVVNEVKRLADVAATDLVPVANAVNQLEAEVSAGNSAITDKLGEISSKLDGEGFGSGGETLGEAAGRIGDAIDDAQGEAGEHDLGWPEYAAGGQGASGVLPEWIIPLTFAGAPTPEQLTVDLSLGPWFSEFETPIAIIRALAALVVAYWLIRSLMAKMDAYIIAIMTAPQVTVAVGTENAIPGAAQAKALLLAGAITVAITASMTVVLATIEIFAAVPTGGSGVVGVLSTNYVGALGWIGVAADTLLPLSVMVSAALTRLVADFVMPPILFTAVTVIRFLGA